MSFRDDSTKKIYKFDVNPTGNTINISEGAHFLSVGIQPQGVVCWIETDPLANQFEYELIVKPTGAFAPDGAVYIGTFSPENNLWFHLYARWTGK